MAIKGIDVSLTSLQKIKNATQQTAPTQAPKEVSQGEGGKGTFADMVKEAIQDVDSLHNQADAQIEGLLTGKEGVTTHDAMIALEKADIAFQLMNSIRGKIVRAYEEVMRTQV